MSEETKNYTVKETIVALIWAAIVKSPGIAAVVYVVNECPDVIENPSDNSEFVVEQCIRALEHPLWTAFIISLSYHSVAAWIYSTIKQSLWVVDFFWHTFPILLAFFYMGITTTNDARNAIIIASLFVWAGRLLYNFFRKENWTMGATEDWRYAEFRQQWGKHFWWSSFFALCAFQTVMCFGLQFPIYYLFAYGKLSQPFFITGFVLIWAGIIIQAVADNQLDAFMEENRLRKERGEKPVGVLNSGLWYYSRHPNYFAEALHWAGYGVAAIGIAPWYVCLSPVVVGLGLFLGDSVRRTEVRIERNESRKAEWEEYKATTSAFIPLPKFKSKKTGLEEKLLNN